MKTIIIIAAWAIMGLFVQNVNAQDQSNQQRIEQLEAKKETVQQTEREKLKEEVEEINSRLAAGEIDVAEAQRLKQDAAEKHARNIEDKIAIIDKQIDLYKRNPDEQEERSFSLRIFGKEHFFEFKDTEDNSVVRLKYDRRTYSSLVVGIGLNNAIIKGQSLQDSPYKIGGSRFFELGWAWKTRVFDNSNWLRFKYGFSFQFNGLKIEDNQYFVEQGDQTVLETFPLALNKAKLRMDNLVFPVHFEFGPSKRIEGDDYFRYSTVNKFKIGLGGYAGINLLTIQKLKYEENGNDQKDKLKRNYNTNNLIYGLSGYVAWGSVALYAKYDLNTIFKDNPVEQHNVSLGVRFDVD
ncbi:MAG: hypothetical protein V7767_14185 [Leeuwenhoekiella sp.]